jgi:hypothetical protein
LSCREHTSGRAPPASLEAAIFCKWPFSAISQESETRGLCDGRRSRGATELAANVRDVAVNGMRTQHQLLCDLTIAETPCHAGENLTLTFGQQDLLRVACIVRRRLARCERFAARADDGLDITMPREVGTPLQRNECRTRYRGRDLPPESVRYRAVLATMDDQRGLPDEGKVRTYVKAIDET